MKEIVLMYHDVIKDDLCESGFNSPGANYYKIKESLFESHISTIADLITQGKIQSDNVVLTFDDGGQSFYDIIAPILEKYGFIGHFFISTKYLGHHAFLSNEEVKGLSESGHIIGSHSVTHPSNIQALSNLERKIEWTESVALLESITGKKVTEISIPNGYYSSSDASLFGELGIKTIYTSRISDKFILDELNIIGRFSITQSTTAKSVERMLTSRIYIWGIIFKQNLIYILKLMLGGNYIKLKKLFRQ